MALTRLLAIPPPGSLPPVTVYDRNGFRILLHFSQTGAPGHPEVQVLLLTMMSTAPQPIWDITFQVAVPKVRPFMLCQGPLRGIYLPKSR